MDHPEECECFGCKARSISIVGHRVVGDRFQRDREKDNRRELDAYRNVRKEGSQPSGTRMHQIEEAKRLSDSYGVAYRADDMTKTLTEAGYIESTQPLSEQDRERARGVSGNR